MIYTLVYNHKIQVKFEFWYNPPIIVGVMVPFWFYIHCFVRTLEFHIRSITLLQMVTGHFGPKPSRPLDTSAPSHLGPKPSRPHLKINSWTLRPLVISAPSHLGPTVLVTSAPVWKFKYILYFCTIFAYYNSFQRFESNMSHESNGISSSVPALVLRKNVYLYLFRIIYLFNLSCL